MRDLTKVESRRVKKSLVLSFLRITPEIQGNRDEMERYQSTDAQIQEFPHYLDKQVVKPTSIRSERSRTKRPGSTATCPVSRLVGAQSRYKCGAAS